MRILLIFLPLIAFGQTAPKAPAVSQPDTTKRSIPVPSEPPKQISAPPLQQTLPQVITTPNKGNPPYFEKAFAPENLSDWAVVLIGLVGTLVAVRSLSLLKTQTQATEVAANAAIKSAEVAEAALKIAESAVVLLDRAGISPTPLDKSSTIRLSFKNFGRTSAKNLLIAATLRIKGVPQKENRLGPLELAASDTVTANVGTFVDFLTYETFEQIRTGQIKIGFTATVTYENVFGDPQTATHGGTYIVRDGTFSRELDRSLE